MREHRSSLSQFTPQPCVSPPTLPHAVLHSMHVASVQQHDDPFNMLTPPDSTPRRCACISLNLGLTGESSPEVNPPRCICTHFDGKIRSPLFILHRSVLALGSMIEPVIHCVVQKQPLICLLQHHNAQTKQQSSTQVPEHDARAAGVRLAITHC